MTDLTAWLLEQITEDERCIDSDDALGEPFVPFGSDRVLAECDAKRQIVATHARRAPGYCPTCVESDGRDDLSELWAAQDYPCQTGRILALPYADRAGYREEWKP